MSVKIYKIQNSGSPIYFIAAFFLCFFFHQSSPAQNQHDLIFVQITAGNKSSEAAKRQSSALDRYQVKSRIILLTAHSEKPVNLTSEFYAACDPDISFDGRQIIFAGKKTKQDRWQLWKMKPDGSGKEVLTSSEMDCFMPVYAGNRFYLDDPQPTPQIIYSGIISARPERPEIGPITALFGTDTTGQTVHRLTFNLYSDSSPDILSNGRIVFSSWQPLDGGKRALLALNIDGTDLMPYYGNHQPPIYKEMVHISDSDERVYYIESDTLYWLGGGDIAVISQNRPLHSYRKVTTAKDGIYNTPCPLPDGGLVASYRPIESGEFALYTIDPDKGVRQELIYAEAGWHALDAQVMMAHTPVKGRSNWLIPGTVTGVFYCLNAYRSNLPEADTVNEGEIKFVRVIEGIAPKKSNEEPQTPSDVVSDTETILIPRRILGTVPVEADGSFQIKVPAEIPINFQMLNENYIKIREQKGWTWVIGNENRGCIGCHEDPELSPPNVLVKAVTKPAVDLAMPPQKTQIIDFRRQIAPIINQKCATAKCHVAGKASPSFEPAKQKKTNNRLKNIYWTLLNPTVSEKELSYVIPGSALKSWLIRILLEKPPGSSITKGSNNQTITHKHFLSEQERLTFIEWIDLGAPWDLSDYDTSEFRKSKTN